MLAIIPDLYIVHLAAPMRWLSPRLTALNFSAGIDAAQPWRSCYSDNITYTDWQRNNYWRAILSVTGSGKTIGYESDHISISQMHRLETFYPHPKQLIWHQQR